jgi:hypothetical protein
VCGGGREQETGTTAMYGGVIILNKLLYLSKLNQRLMHGVHSDEKNTNSTFLFEEPTVTHKKLLAMMKATALYCIPEGRVFQLHGVPSHFLYNICAFVDRKFQRGDIPWPPLSPDLTPLQFCFLQSVKDTVYQKEMNEWHERIV